MTVKNRTYSEKNIKSLSGLESIRAKPSMYVGSTDEFGLWNTLREALDNAVDEALGGRNDSLTLYFGPDKDYYIADNGEGVPVKPISVKDAVTGATHKVPALKAIVSLTHTSGKFDNSAYAASRGTHGVGIKCCSALGEEFTVWTFREGDWWTISYKKGVLQTDVSKTRAPKLPWGTPKKGTVIYFKPDLSIFTKSKFPASLCLDWAEITSYLTAKFKITILSHTGSKKEFYSTKGVLDFISKRVTDLKATQLSPKVMHYSSDLIDLALTFTDYDGNGVQAFTNGLRNVDGGTHVDSLYAALRRAIRPFEPKKKKKDDSGISIFELKEGLVGVINAKLSTPKFTSQTKDKLAEEERAGKILEDALFDQISLFFKENKSLAAKLVDRCIQLKELKNKFKASKKVLQELNKIKRKGMPNKFAAANPSVRPGDIELFLVEGDSAGGPCKDARYPHQAILPLKGKILNCFSGETEVLKSDGSTARLDSLQDGWVGFGFDIESKTSVTSEMSKPFSTKIVTEILCLTFEDGSVVRCTPDHMFLTSEGYVKAEDLTVDHDIITR